MELKELEHKLQDAMNNHFEVTKVYIEFAERLERAKMQVIDPSLRDSAEKQVIRASKEDKSFEQLVLDTDTLRRKKDLFEKELDFLKALLRVKELELQIK